MSIRRRLVFLSLLGVLVLPSPGVLAQDAAADLPAGVPDLDAWVERTLETFEVPGVAVAIVKDGEVVLARGYGIRPWPFLMLMYLLPSTFSDAIAASESVGISFSISRSTPSDTLMIRLSTTCRGFACGIRG